MSNVIPKYLKELMRTGETTDIEMLNFIVSEYFLKNLTLEDFEEDLILNYGASEYYSKALINSFKDALKRIIK